MLISATNKVPAKKKHDSLADESLKVPESILIETLEEKETSLETTKPHNKIVDETTMFCSDTEDTDTKMSPCIAADPTT